MKAAAAHPDAGGSQQAFIQAWARYTTAKDSQKALAGDAEICRFPKNRREEIIVLVKDDNAGPACEIRTRSSITIPRRHLRELIEKLERAETEMARIAESRAA
jgi:hypothetical protein